MSIVTGTTRDERASTKERYTCIKQTNTSIEETYTHETRRITEPHIYIWYSTVLDISLCHMSLFMCVGLFSCMRVSFHVRGSLFIRVFYSTGSAN